MLKLRVGVLMGGKSIEHEVSFNSGRTVCDHLDPERFQIIPLYQHKSGDLYLLPWHFLHRGKTSDFVQRLPQEASKITLDSLKNRIDFMFIATHGRFAEDGTLQGMLEILKIPYLGAKVFGSALGMDKALQRLVLKAHGVEIPKGIIVYPFENDIEIIKAHLTKENIHYPLIIKPHKEGSSLGMAVAFNEEELMQGLEKALYAHPEKPQSVIIEEKIVGMEFSCIIITDYLSKKLLPLPITEIVPESGSHFFDYEQKYMPGRARKFTPARCSQEDTQKIQETVSKVMAILEFDNFCRTDGFLTPDGRVIIIDPNSLSGMGPSSFLFNQAAQLGMGHTKLINHLIDTELEGYGMLSADNKHQEISGSTQRIAVLLGGDSNEREISLESGRNICYKLSPHKYKALPIFITKNFELYRLTERQLTFHATQEIEESVEESQKLEWDDLPKLCDFVFIGLHGGKGENGCVQGMLEMLGMPYNGSSVLASALCMNKYKTTEFLQHNGFEVPCSTIITKKSFEKNSLNLLKNIQKTFSLPAIAKPSSDGCSVGVYKITSAEELKLTIPKLLQDYDEIMIEEFITGIELTVGVIGNEKPYALPPSQAVASKGVLSIEEKFLPGAGENQTPAPLPQDALQLVQKTMEAVYKVVGIKGYCRIDCFYQTAKESPTGKERVIILEINTLPGMTPATCIFHQAAELGIKPMEFVDLLVQLGMQEHKNIPVEDSLLANLENKQIIELK